MELSEELRRKMEMNRAAAIARRKASALQPIDHLGKQQQQQQNLQQEQNVLQAKTIQLLLELCSPSEFLVTLAQGCIDEDGRVHQIFDRLATSVASSWRSSKRLQCPVFNLKNYELVTDQLKRIRNVQLQHVPRSTRNALESHAGCREWEPFHPRHVPDSIVEQLLLKISRKLRQCLLPFQWEGVRYGLRRGGRILIADDMGVGKTIQAIAIAACYLEHGPLLVVCPASLRLMWAEELERWIPSLRPSELHLVFGRKDDLVDSVTPRVVVISYNMLKRLRQSMLDRQWETVIVDESHNLRCSRRVNECDEVATVIQVSQAARRAIFLSGTPSLSRPFDIYNQVDCLWKGILGKNKYEFAKNYCDSHYDASNQKRDFTKGVRLDELNLLLTETVMIRRLKIHLLSQLPPKRRQVIRLQLTSVDVALAKAQCNKLVDSEDEIYTQPDSDAKELETPEANLTVQEVGVAKQSGVQEWLSNNISGDEGHKMILFGHHHKVLNSLQDFVVSKGIEFVRIDGFTEAKDRQKAVDIFRRKAEVKVAIVGVTAGGVGLDLSSAQTLVFAELPKTASEILQAEDRAHRRGQKNAVNIYFFCAKDTTDESHWQSLNASLERVSTMTNGTRHAIPGLEVVSVDDKSSSTVTTVQCQLSPTKNTEHTIASQLHEHVALTEIEEACELIDAKSLMFEVSANTGRVHLHKKLNGRSTLFYVEENFKPEELDAESSDLPACLVHSAGCRNAAIRFITEWQELRPVYRKKLFGKALEPPLSKELIRARQDVSFVEGGLVKGGSRRRRRPVNEMPCSLPEGAHMKEILLYKSNPSREFLVTQPWSADGEPLCKLCHEDCSNSAAKDPKCMLDFFCGKSCYEEYKLKTSQQYVRQELFQLERGVCDICNMDCHAMVECIRNLSVLQRSDYILQKAPSFAKHPVLLDRLVKDPSEGNAWHADHIVPVYKGGGECNLENLRTLCVACHAEVTKLQCQQRASVARKAQKTLNFSIEEMLTRAKRFKETGDDYDDKDLLVEVTGSAYSKKAADLR